MLTGSHGDVVSVPWRYCLFLGEETALFPPAARAPVIPPGTPPLLAGDPHTQMA